MKLSPKAETEFCGLCGDEALSVVCDTLPSPLTHKVLQLTDKVL